MRKVKTTLQAFPTPEQVLYDEMAALLAEVEGFGSYFRQTFVKTPDQEALHNWYWNQDDGSLLIAYLYGGTGSGKSVGALSLVMDLISRFPGTRGLIARHTYDELTDSVLETLGTNEYPGLLDKWGFPYHCKKDPPGYTFPNGSRLLLRSEKSTMKPSDRGAKASSLGSTAYDLVMIEEADGVSERFFLTLVGRMRQGSLPRPVILLVSNPPTEDHWLYRIFWGSGLGSKKTQKFHFTLENNRQNVRSGYIEDLEATLASYPTLYKKFRLGLPGPDARGRPYFNGLFHKHIHVAPGPIKWDPKYPLWRVWDSGWRRPACLIFQDNPRTGQILFLYAKLGSEQLLGSFASREIQLHHQMFHGAEWRDVADVATRQRKANAPKSELEVLEGLGLNVITEYSLIEYGLNLWEDLLCTTLPAKPPDFPGGPAILIDPVHCQLLIDALDFGYCQDENSKSDEVRPVKDGYYDHIMDCSRYGLVQVRTLTSRKVPKEKKRKEWRPISVGGMYDATPVDLRSLTGGGGRRIATYGFGRKGRRF